MEARGDDVKGGEVAGGKDWMSMGLPKDLDINITGEEFFRIVKGETLHGLTFVRLETLDSPHDRLSFFYRTYHFEWNGQPVRAMIATVYWGDSDGSFHTAFTHACGEPSEIGPRFFK